MEGVIYFNMGEKCLTRLAVSLFSLRKVYNGNCTILCDKGSYNECKLIADRYKADIKCSRYKKLDRNTALFNKCRLHLYTPYDKTLFIDSDTIVLKDFSDAFKYLNEYEFIVAQMSNWLSSGRKIGKRINGWNGKIPERFIAHAKNEPKAVNTGFYGWNKGALIFNDWSNTTRRNLTSFIPDEIACQILLPHFNHLVISHSYNTSCKHDIIDENTYTIHYHGRKHCQIDADGKYLYNSDIWYKYFDQDREFFSKWANLDKRLSSNLSKHK